MAVRGGSWLSDGRALSASARNAQDLDIPQPITGFRCARRASDTPCKALEPGLYSGTTRGGDNGTLRTVGVGCSGVVSVLGSHGSGGRFHLVGVLDEGGHVTMEGTDIAAPKTVQRFEGEVVDGQRLRGTWSSGDGKTGTWSVARKR